jgi:hypothetical protein
MAKAKREWVRTEMIKRLRSNRDGRLTPSQWLAITGDPLTTVLLLLAPALLIIGLRLPMLAGRLWLIIPILIVALGVMLLIRARRFARVPLQALTLRTAPTPIIRRLLGRIAVMRDADGNVYRFKIWLAPQIPLRADQDYLVYALEDGNQHVLCSVIPGDDPEALHYQPSAEFRRRFNRRAAAEA